MGISSLAGAHRTLVPRVVKELRERGRGDILVVCGGVIPPQDYQELYEAGVLAIYGPGTTIPHSAIELLDVLERNMKGPAASPPPGGNSSDSALRQAG